MALAGSLSLTGRFALLFLRRPKINSHAAVLLWRFSFSLFLYPLQNNGPTEVLICGGVFYFLWAAVIKIIAVFLSASLFFNYFCRPIIPAAQINRRETSAIIFIAGLYYSLCSFIFASLNFWPAINPPPINIFAFHFWPMTKIKDTAAAIIFRHGGGK